jgi:hypothetical protein
MCLLSTLAIIYLIALTMHLSGQNIDYIILFDVTLMLLFLIVSFSIIMKVKKLKRGEEKNDGLC